MDIMKPRISSEIPLGDDWIYEVKYDGFRCVLTWDTDGTIKLLSKNNTDLTINFPEITSYCLEAYPLVKSSLPLTLDGELVIANTDHQSNFSLLQKRGRLKNQESIQEAASVRPATLILFDLLVLKGKSYKSQKLYVRKKRLKLCFINFMENAFG